MKANIKQLTDAHVSDSKEHIAGNVAIHLIEEARNMENGYYFYLTDDEIRDFEADISRQTRLMEDVEAWIIKNYNLKKTGQ